MRLIKWFISWLKNEQCLAWYWYDKKKTIRACCQRNKFHFGPHRDNTGEWK